MKSLKIFIFCQILSTTLCQADSSVSPLSYVKPSETLRIRGFSEMMLPALQGTGGFVPKPQGRPFVPPFLSAQIGVDFEVLPNLRAFYLQKGLLIWPKISGGPFGGRPLDPRVGVRKTQVFEVQNLTSEYDFFIQPGLYSAFVTQPGRSFDLGIRLSHRYSILNTNLTVGLNFEAVYTFYREQSSSSDLTGVLAPWASYSLSQKFSTQHWIYGFYRHMRHTPISQFEWDITEMPYIQNGITFRASESVQISGLVNCYLLEVPKLNTLWSSIWISFKI